MNQAEKQLSQIAAKQFLTTCRSQLATNIAWVEYYSEDVEELRTIYRLLQKHPHLTVGQLAEKLAFPFTTTVGLLRALSVKVSQENHTRQVNRRTCSSIFSGV